MPCCYGLTSEKLCLLWEDVRQKLPLYQARSWSGGRSQEGGCMSSSIMTSSVGWHPVTHPHGATTLPTFTPDQYFSLFVIALVSLGPGHCTHHCELCMQISTVHLWQLWRGMMSLAVRCQYVTMWRYKYPGQVVPAPTQLSCIGQLLWKQETK